MEEEIKWIVNNWDKIPEEFKEGNTIWLYDNIEFQGYEWCAERIGITKEAAITWGFDSGCSCNSAWDGSFDNYYDIAKTWKEFEVANIKDFPENTIKECMKKIAEIKEKTGV